MLLAVVAVGSLAYFGYMAVFAPHSSGPRMEPQTQVALARALPEWTEEDTSRCQARARAARDAKMPAGSEFSSRAVTDGFGPMATMVECRITTKVERFCDATAKTALVAMVNDYLGRVDLIRLGLGLEGAPMAVLGAVFGGEIAAGDGVHDMLNEGTLTYMTFYNKRVADGLRRLGRDGIVTASDFGGLSGKSTSSMITEIFDGLAVERQVCVRA